MKPPAELGGPLLRSVSRSFYLSIKVLPEPIRAPIGLAYLLARASDTIADSTTVAPELRLRHLASFEAMICGETGVGLDALQSEIVPADESERRLIAQTGRCLDWLASLDDAARSEIRSVLREIIHGQTLDLQRFHIQRPGQITSLQTAAELEEYTYLVAGCVGAFWTRICLARLPHYSRMDVAELCRLGVNFGKALQLVNILRDLPADLREGRCYLPTEELRIAETDAGGLLATPRSGQAVFGKWHARATSLAEDGARYIAAIRPPRLRIACFLPWYLARKTLDLIKRQPPLETAVRLKVPRSTVRRALFLAPLLAISDRPLRMASS